MRAVLRVVPISTFAALFVSVPGLVQRAAGQCNTVPCALTFSAATGQSPPTQSLTINVTGGVFFSASVTLLTPSGGIQWLAVNPPTGTLGGGMTGAPTVRPDIVVTSTGLPAGSYNANIVLKVTGGGDPTITVPVTLTVAGSSVNPCAMVSPCSFTFSTGMGQTSMAQSLTIDVPGASFYNSSVSLASTANGIQWLAVLPASGTLGGITGSPTVRPDVVVNAAGLPAGAYSATINLKITGGGDPTIPIPVTLSVAGSAPVLTFSPAALTLSASEAGTPVSQSVVLSTGASVSFTASASSSGGWLSVSPGSGTSAPTASLTVTANPASLKAGTYAGTITVASGSTQQTLSVTLTVSAKTPVVLAADSASLAFTVQQGGAAPAAQTVRLTSTGGPANFSLTPSVAWLKVTPASGVTPATVTLSVDPSGLAPGSVSGVVNISAPGTTGIQAVSVTLAVSAPSPVITTVANAASSLQMPIAPGLILTIQGKNLGPAQLVRAAAGGNALAASLSGARVLVSGVPAPILYVRSDQIGAIAPYEIAGQASATVEVEYQGVRSAATTVPVATSAPGLFTLDQSGRGQGAILNQDLSVNGPDNPADPQSIIVLYLTGDGLEDAASADGAIIQGPPFPKPVLPVSATVGSAAVPAENILYAGAAPLSVAGLMQINLKLPPNVSGQAPVTVTIGGASSQPGVMVSIK